MGRIFICGLLLLFLYPSCAFSKLTVTCDVIELVRHERLVTLQWKVTVRSDKAWDACDLIISFQDGEGKEIFRIKEIKRVMPGPNSFTGHKIHDLKLWDRVKKYLATFDCLF